MICQTPPFRLLLGISEYLFRDKVLLESAIEAALFSKDIRGDDCEFYTCAKGWVDCIQDKNEAGYASKFLETRDFFQDRIDESRKVSDRMLMRLASATNNN